MKTSYRLGRGLARLVLVALGTRWIGVDRVPRSGRLVVASNHRSYMDPPLVGCGLGRELHFFAKRELFQVPVLGRVIRDVFNSIPVRRAEADRRSLALSIESVKNGGALVVFPEGTRSRGEGFLEPKIGVGMIADRAGADIVPVYIDGSGRGAGGLLSSALRRRRIRVVYGDPIPLEEAAGDAPDRGRRYAAIARTVMERIARLADELARETS